MIGPDYQENDSEEFLRQHKLLVEVLMEWQRKQFMEKTKEEVVRSLMAVIHNGYNALRKQSAMELAGHYIDFVLRDARGSQKHARTLQGSDLWDFCVADASLRHPEYKP